MNIINIEQVSPRIIELFFWRNSRKISLHLNKSSSTYRLIRMLKGGCDFIVDGKHYCCRDESILLLPAGTKYSGKIIGDDILMFNLSFNITKDSDDGTGMDKTPANAIKRYSFSDYPIFNEPQLLTSESTLSICNKILREAEMTQALYNEYICLYIHQLFLCIARENQRQDIAGKSDATQKIIDYISKNINSDINVNTIANRFSYHPNYIARIMKRATGMSLHRYILDTKLKAAENLLCTTDYNIIDIAMTLSFSNSSHFAQKFKQKYKMTPSEYRKKYS